MTAILLILLSASIIVGIIAIISFFMTSPARGGGSSKSKSRKKNKRKKNRAAANGNSGDRDIRITKHGSCVYPPEAKKLGIEKVVYIDVHVGEDGKIIEFQVPSKTTHGFEEASCKYIKQWDFKPAIQDGQPVDAWVRVPIKFALKKVSREV